MGLISQLTEDSRAARAHDDKFWKSLLYYFQMRVPQSKVTGASNVFLYPLILPPDSIQMSEPFAVDQSFTAGGGLFVEEQGQIARTITITGNTGWKPKRHQNAPNLGPGALQLENPSFTRDTTRRSSMLMALSGQRHFQFLQDAVFRTYGDLKRNPETAEETALWWHNVKDDEHWRVIPLEFKSNRQAGDLLYHYQIELLAVPQSVAPFRAPEDRPVTSLLTQPLEMIRAGTGLAQAALQDLGNVQVALRQQSASMVGLLDGAIDLVDTSAALLNGAADIITTPFVQVNATIQHGLDAMADLYAAELARSDAVIAVGPRTRNALWKLLDALAIIGSYPAKFRTDIQARVDAILARQSTAGAYSTSALANAAALDAPDTLGAMEAQGTGPSTGDQARAAAEPNLGRTNQRYTSAWERVLEDGDTLINLASRFLGDARYWRFLVMFNDLRAPYISPNGQPGTLGVGDRILIPSFAPAAGPRDSPATLGVRLDEPAVVHALGRDLRMELVAGAGDQFDLVVDVNGGGTDFQLVEGLPNLTQALTLRVLTERGTDPMFRELGADRVIGIGVGVVDAEAGRIRFGDAVAADPRVSGVASVEFSTTTQPEVMVAEVTAEVRGFARPERVILTAPANA